MNTHSENIKIIDFSSEGLGVGRRSSGQVVMLRGAVPGDTVSANLKDAGTKGTAFGNIDAVVKSSDQRIEHSCPHYAEGCAGCLLGVYNYREELLWKSNHLQQTLRRIGKITAPVLRKIIPSEDSWNYRDRIELHLEISDGKIDIGYLNNGELVSINDCHLGAKRVRQSLKLIRVALLQHSSNLSDKSFRLLIRDNGRGQAAAVIFTKTGAIETRDFLRQLLDQGNFAGWEIRLVSDFKLRYQSEKILDQSGDASIHVRIGESTLPLPLNAFTQTNIYNAGRLRDYVVDLVPKAGRLLDIYGGYGAFAFEYAGNEGGKALVLDSSKSMVLAGRRFAKSHRLAVRFARVNLRKFNQLDFPAGTFDCAILDPPRRGVHTRVIQYLNQQGPPIMIYVSCQAAALARDLQRLNNYVPEFFQPIDMFPNTPELETIALLRRVKRSE